MPFQEKDSKFNQKLAAMRLGHDSNIDMEDPGNMEHMMYPHQFDSTDENSFPAMKLEKATDSPLLHKNFYNSFVDVLQPLKHLK